MAKKQSETEELETQGQDPLPLPTHSFDAVQFSKIDESGEKAAQLLADLPVGQGYYFKLYKRPTTPGRPIQFMCPIELNEPIDDLEGHIQQLVAQHNWGSGDYLIRVMIHGKPGVQPGTLTLHITQLGKIEKPSEGNGKSGNESLDIISQAAGMAKAFKEIVAPFIPTQNGPQSNLSDSLPALAEAMATTLKAGIDASKNSTPPQPQESAKDIIKVIMTEMKEVLAKRDDHDPLKMLKLMKEAGLIPEKKDDDNLGQIKNLVAIISTLRDLNPAEPAGRISTTAEVLKALSPHIGEVVGTIKEGISLVKTRMGQPRTEAPRLGPVGDQPKIQTSDVPSHPFLQELKAAVDKNDQNYFPRLVHAIGYWLENGDQYLASAVSGTMSVDWVCGYLTQIGGEYFRQGRVKDYLAAFIDWYRKYLSGVMGSQSVEQTPVSDTTVSEESSVMSEIHASCSKCGEPYGFASIEDWNLDNKVCNETNNGNLCGGKIELEQPPAKGNA